MGKVFEILYIHGMGGGGDSRIPNILKDYFRCQGGSCCDTDIDVNVTIRTYPFDPQEAEALIAEWVGELCPDLVIGESLGATYALNLAASRPCILVSPALGAPVIFGRMAWMTKIPGVCKFLNRKYKAQEGDRQMIEFSYRVMKGYGRLYDSMLKADRSGRRFAFFGMHDHYRRTGVVSVRRWMKLFGHESCMMYDGTHFMEEEYIYTLLIPEIIRTLTGEFRD